MGWLLAGVFALAAALRLYGITAECLWLDEGFTLDKVSRPFGEMLAATARDVHMPLHDIIVWPFLQLFGESEWVLRLPSLVFNLLTLWFAGRIALLLFGERARLFTVALLAISPLHIIYAQEGRPYALFALTAAWSMYRLILFLRAQNMRNAVAWCAVTVLLLYSHYYAAFIVAAANGFVITWWLSARRVRRDVPTGVPPASRPTDEARPPSMRWWFTMQAVTALCVLPWVPFVLKSVSKVQGAFWIPRPNLELLYKLAGYYGAFAAPLLAGLAVYAWVRWRRRPAPRSPEHAQVAPDEPGAIPRPARVMLLAWWLLLPMLLPIALSFVVQPLFHHRFTLGSSTALYILAGSGLALLLPTIARRHLRVALVVLLIGLHVPALAWRWRFERKPEWRDLVALLATRGPSDQLVLAPGEERFAFMYYVREAGLTLEPTRVADVTPGAPSEGRAATTTVWVAQNLFDRRGGDERRIAEHVVPGRALTFEIKYPRLHIQRWEPAN